MDIDNALHHELEELVDVARREMKASRGHNVRDRYPHAVHAAWQAITDRLIAAGATRVIAEWTTTHWILGGEDRCIRDCLQHAEHYAELGLIHPNGHPDGAAP